MPPAAQPRELTMSCIATPAGSIVKLAGVLDEKFQPAAFLELAVGPVVLVDFDQVVRVTSFGVREWMRALRELKARYLGYVNVRPAAMSQFNMVARFGEPGQLLSFYCPYLCDACDYNLDVLFDVRRSWDVLQRARATNHLEGSVDKCPQCGGALTFDDDPAVYLAYVMGAPVPNPPPEVAQMVGGAPKALKIEQVVSGSITGLWLEGELRKTGGFKRLLEGLEGEVVVDLGRAELGPDSAAAMAAVLERGLPVFLTHAPPGLLSRDVLSRASLLSVRVYCSCAAGHGAELRVDRATLVELQRGALPCPRCRAPMALPSPAASEWTRALVEAPQAVAAFIATTPRLPDASSGTEPTVGTPPSGPAFFGRFELVRKLGAGGMAEVFLARQHAVGGFSKPVVLKRILPNLSEDPEFHRMLLAEARLASRISHPNVVTIYDVGEHEKVLFIVMEYVDGADLNKFLKAAVRQGRPFTPAVAVRIVADVCAGLHAAHLSLDEEGRPAPIIHRDVSPHNVLISRTGLVKLGDFGIAKAVETSGLTPSGRVRGKLSYLAPEAITGGGLAIDPRADLFATSVMLYELLTLAHPFKRPSEYQTLMAITSERALDVRALQPSVPDEVAAIVRRGMAYRAADRFASALEMQRALEEWLHRAGERPDVAGACASLLVASSGPPGPPQSLDDNTDTPATPMRGPLPVAEAVELQVDDDPTSD